ncbi:MAG: CarD family transcriptional regulator [Clostridia bacterium]|nr:CarD family transcriptional regulator [Clostridia bacterium]
MAERAVGENVSYGSYGECVILEKKTVDLGLGNKQYYLLEKVGDAKGTIYVPVNKANEVFKTVKRVLTKEEINALKEIEPLNINWDLDDKSREALYKKYFNDAEPKEICALLKGVLLRQSELKKSKKKLRNADVQAIKICEKILFNELVRALPELKSDQVLPLILGTLRAEEVI